MFMIKFFCQFSLLLKKLPKLFQRKSSLYFFHLKRRKIIPSYFCNADMEMMAYVWVEGRSILAFKFRVKGFWKHQIGPDNQNNMF